MMDRRRFLGLTSGGIIAAGPLLAGRGRALAQGASPRAAGRPVAPRPEPPQASAPGVSARDIKIGMSAAFKGAAAGLGTELWRGAAAYYSEVNARGGINGRQLVVAALDDGYQPEPCVRNTIDLVEKEQVFFLANYVGTPTLTRALPLIKRYGDIVMVGNFTGAQPQREAPYVDWVFNIRASYRQEMAGLVDRFWTQGARKFGVFYQIDAYGRSGADGVARALAHRGPRITAEATYVRGARFEEDMGPAVTVLRQAGCDVVLCTGAYQGCGAFVRTARDAGWTVPIANVSFVGSDAMLQLLLKHGKTTGRDYTRGPSTPRSCRPMTTRACPASWSTARSWTSTAPRRPRRSATAPTRPSATASSASKASSMRRSPRKGCAGPAPTRPARASGRPSRRSRDSTSASAPR